jgi:hypothetical protein
MAVQKIFCVLYRRDPLESGLQARAFGVTSIHYTYEAEKGPSALLQARFKAKHYAVELTLLKANRETAHRIGDCVVAFLIRLRVFRLRGPAGKRGHFKRAAATAIQKIFCVLYRSDPLESGLRGSRLYITLMKLKKVDQLDCSADSRRRSTTAPRASSF